MRMHKGDDAVPGWRFPLFCLIDLDQLSIAQRVFIVLSEGIITNDDSTRPSGGQDNVKTMDST